VEKCGDFAKAGVGMKKLLGVAIVFVATVLLAACGGERELDFRSVLDVETDMILRLGDSLSDFEDVLGVGENVELEWEWTEDIENFASYYFANGILYVFFVDDEAVGIIQDKESTRFQFSDMSFDMTSADIAGRFVDRGLDSEFFIIYDRFYDSRGRDVSDREDADYGARIIYWIDDLLDQGVGMLEIFVIGWDNDFESD